MAASTTTLVERAARGLKRRDPKSAVSITYMQTSRKGCARPQHCDQPVTVRQVRYVDDGKGSVAPQVATTSTPHGRKGSARPKTMRRVDEPLYFWKWTFSPPVRKQPTFMRDALHRHALTAYGASGNAPAIPTQEMAESLNLFFFDQLFRRSFVGHIPSVVSFHRRNNHV